jgi:hypothetical protein
VSNRCKGCLPGKTNVAGDDASGANTTCDATICTANQHVVGNACIACPDGTTRPAGDDASGKDTTCSPVLCPANHFVMAKSCKPCPAGQINGAGDDASGADTTCKQACDLAGATVQKNWRCSRELWQVDPITREAAVKRCSNDPSCKGLMWLNNRGGDGRTASQGWYQGCAGDVGSMSNNDWDTIVLPSTCL